MNFYFKRLLISLSILISLTGFTYFIYEPLYNYIVKEDGWIESLTALSLLLMSILFLIRFIRTRKHKKALWLSFNLLLIIACFFGFGEEISWGQRIFSIESNVFFLENNLQNEINLHNLEVKGIKLNKAVFSLGLTVVAGCYFLFFNLLYLKSNIFWVLCNRSGIPIPKLYQTALMLIFTLLIMIIPSHKKWELWEGVFTLMLFLIFIDPYNSKEQLIPDKSQKKTKSYVQ